MVMRSMTNENENRMKHYIGLFLTLLISFLALFQYDIILFGEQPKSDILPAGLQLLLPGVSFALFLLICLLKRTTILRLFLYLIPLLVVYCGMIILSLMTFGIGVPAFGAVGAVGIAVVLDISVKEKINYWRFAGLGFSSTLPGWIACFGLSEKLGDGIIFGIIICGWQLAIGYLVIKQLTGQKIGWESDFDKQLREYQEEEINSQQS